MWDEQYETINEERKRLTVELDRLEEEKKALISMKKKELIEDGDFKDEFAEVKDRIADQHTKLAKVRMETFNIDEAVDYVFGFVGTLPETWFEADFTQKQQLQSLIFPEKPVYTYSGFETPVLSSMFATKRTHHMDESSLVSRSILGWNTLEPLILKLNDVFTRFDFSSAGLVSSYR